jgi:hypothetical protein
LPGACAQCVRGRLALGAVAEGALPPDVEPVVRILAIAGLGHVLYQSALDIFPAMILVGMIAVALTGAAMTALLGQIETRAMPWRRA